MALVVDVNQAATALGVSRRTIYRLIDAGDLGSVHVRGALRIPREELDRFVSDGLAADAAHRQDAGRLARRRR